MCHTCVHEWEISLTASFTRSRPLLHLVLSVRMRAESVRLYTSDHRVALRFICERHDLFVSSASSTTAPEPGIVGLHGRLLRMNNMADNRLHTPASYSPLLRRRRRRRRRLNTVATKISGCTRSCLPTHSPEQVRVLYRRMMSTA